MCSRVVPALVGMLALSACSVGSAPEPGATTSYASATPEQILADAVRAMGSLESFHVEHAAVIEGAEVRVRVAVAQNGDCAGSMTGPRGVIDFRRVSGIDYVKLDPDYLQTLDPRQAVVLNGRWLAERPSPVAAAACGVVRLLDQLEEAEVDEHVAGETVVDGVRAVGLAFTAADTGRVYVSVDEPHVVVKIEIDGVPTLFSGFDKQPAIGAPPASKVIDPSIVSSDSATG